MNDQRQLVKKSSFYILTYFQSSNDRHKLVKSHHFTYLHAYLCRVCKWPIQVGKSHLFCIHAYILTVNDWRQLVKISFFTYLPTYRLQTTTQIGKNVVILHTYFHAYLCRVYKWPIQVREIRIFSYLWPVYERSSQVDFLLTYRIGQNSTRPNCLP